MLLITPKISNLSEIQGNWRGIFITNDKSEVRHVPACLCYTCGMGKKDIISKSVLGHLAADIANLLLGLGVETDSVELLDTEQQRV